MQYNTTPYNTGQCDNLTKLPLTNECHFSCNFAVLFSGSLSTVLPLLCMLNCVEVKEPKAQSQKSSRPKGQKLEVWGPTISLRLNFFVGGCCIICLQGATPEN